LEAIMSRTDIRSTFYAMPSRHSQMIETGRLEEVIEAARSCPAIEDPRQVALREAQFASAREALLRLLV
jgi:hypothetical protein